MPRSTDRSSRRKAGKGINRRLNACDISGFTTNLHPIAGIRCRKISLDENIGRQRMFRLQRPGLGFAFRIILIDTHEIHRQNLNHTDASCKFILPTLNNYSPLLFTCTDEGFIHIGIRVIVISFSGEESRTERPIDIAFGTDWHWRIPYPHSSRTPCSSDLPHPSRFGH